MDYEILKDVTLFKGLHKEQLEKILQLAFVKNYKEGFTLFFEDMQGGIMYVILKGRIDLYKKNEEGDNKFLVSLGPPEYLGELSLIEDDTRSATAKISEESELLVITRKCFNDMIYKEPKIASTILLNICKKLSSRLKNMNEKIIKLEEENE